MNRESIRDLRIYPVKFAGQVVRCLPAMFRTSRAIPEPDFPPAPCL